MKKIFLPIIAFIIIFINVSAQEKSNKELKGDKFFFTYSFDKAIKSYTQTKQLSVEGQRRLAISYHNIDQNIQSESVYEKLISGTAGILPEDYYNYAMILKTNSKYDESGKWMDKFQELKPDDLRARDYAANKDQLSYWLIDDGKYNIEHLNVNTDAEDFGTCYYKNKIVFASTRATPKLINRKDNWTRKPFLDMYVSEVDSVQLKKPEIFDKSLNGKMNDGPASFNKDGTYMAFTRNNYDVKRKDKVVKLEIFFSKNKDGKWSVPEPFVLNNKEYSVGQPCLTSDGNTMYFTSDMPGGYGGTDIYRIIKDEKGEWGKPENLGNKINTEGDDMFPFYEENSGTLFFSSNGHFGLGGLDIFICQIDGAGFGHVSNPGFPLNTQNDDFALIVNYKMSKGYFSSNRSGGSGGDDIYSVDILKGLDINDSKVRFSVIAPKNIPTKRRVRETFPIRNYVFFDLGSSEIPDRYVLLRKDQVKDFREDQLEVFKPKKLSGRSDRQMIVYYNIINILGDRMLKNASTTITLVGASEKGPEDGRAMAESIKRYLVDIFGIYTSRISIEGRDKPKIPSEQPGGTNELGLLREGDHRVSIESSSPDLLMEFQSGPDAPLKPVEIIGIQEAPLDSYVSFNVEGVKEPITSWKLEIMDKNGKVQYFGPYTHETLSIPGKSILGTRPSGDYKVTMIGQTKSGKMVRKGTSVYMVLWTPPQNEEMMRFSVIFEINESKAITIYERYLTDIIIPKIPKNAQVIISGHTDIIGDESYNQKLSLARARDVRDILEKGLSVAGRNDVTFVLYGFGEDLEFSPFNNNFPEERFYNRTVIIDIIPQE